MFVCIIFYNSNVDWTGIVMIESIFQIMTIAGCIYVLFRIVSVVFYEVAMWIEDNKRK